MDDPKKPHGSGHSTYELIDKERFFEVLDLKRSMVLMDLGSGGGDYTIALAGSVGPAGHIWAVDAWEEGLARIRERAIEKQLHNISTLLADVNIHIPLSDRTIDLCLMACVLHDLLRDGPAETVLREISRVLKPGGKLAVLEFKKIDHGPGPPAHIRLAQEDVIDLLTPFRFTIENVSEAGKYHYLLMATLPA
jgi:ubiquinone/menaquinone biosynthesis C-methylase UbiE